MSNVWDEFDLDYEAYDPVVAYISNGFDSVPNNFEMVKESAIINGFDIVLLTKGFWYDQPRVGVYKWFLLFKGRLRMLQNYIDFYYGDDQSVKVYPVKSIEIGSPENYHVLYADNVPTIKMADESNPTEIYITVDPGQYMGVDNERDCVNGFYIRKFAVVHDAL